jgi:lysophospholipase L1-like esterase
VKKEPLYYLLMTLMVAGLCFGAWVVAEKIIVSKGKGLNQAAWEAAYRERRQAVPPSGPREGYWGARLGAKTPDELLGWHDPEVEISGMISIDAQGLQHYASPGKDLLRILILGGSVASGAYASDISNTYFNVLGRVLAEQGIPVEIIVFASGGWKSIQELKALQRRPGDEKPDLILFLDGLNDITNGATAELLTGQGFNGPDGKVNNPLFRISDYERRVSLYLENMKAAATFAANSGIRMVVALQPSLAERAPLSPIESKLLQASLQRHASLEAIRESYAQIRQNLLLMEEKKQLVFIDCSKIFNHEKETVFADMWHFSDIGHQILGNTLAEKLSRFLIDPKPARIPPDRLRSRE